MKDKYSAKEILLGLRDEFLLIQERLNEVDGFLDYDRYKYMNLDKNLSPATY